MKLILFLLLSASGFGAVKISSDPFDNLFAQHKTEVEPSIFSHGQTMVSAFQVGRFFAGGSTDIGWATSQDSGKTWHQGFLPEITKFVGNGAFDRTSDASVAYDVKHGVWLISSLGIYINREVPSILVSRSVDDGLTWENPISVSSAGSGYDKNWTVCDNHPNSPYFGSCYTQWDDNHAESIILISTSNDGGLTWSAAEPTEDQAKGEGGQPVIQPDGTVVIPIVAADAKTLLSFVSRDGGKTWSSPNQVTAVTAHLLNHKLRGPGFPSAAVDGDGKIFVVGPDCRFEKNCVANDIVITTSTDGIHWSDVSRIPIDSVGSGVDHFIPSIAVDEETKGNDARVAISYYYYPKSDCTSDCELRIASVTSSDGGKSFSEPVDLAGPLDWKLLPVTISGFMVGDYIASTFVGGKSYSVFPATTSTELAIFVSE